VEAVILIGLIVSFYFMLTPGGHKKTPQKPPSSLPRPPSSHPKPPASPANYGAESSPSAAKAIATSRDVESRTHATSTMARAIVDAPQHRHESVNEVEPPEDFHLHVNYRNRRGYFTDRPITVLARGAEYILAQCHKTGERRWFKRQRLVSGITPEGEVISGKDLVWFIDKLPVRHGAVVNGNGKPALGLSITSPPKQDVPIYLIDYCDGEYEVTSREIEVHRFSRKYIYAYCTLRDDYRCFRRDRISFARDELGSHFDGHGLFVELDRYYPSLRTTNSFFSDIFSRAA
jgi:hypothetical protein